MLDPNFQSRHGESEESLSCHIKPRHARRALRRDPRAHHADPSVRRAIYNDADEDPRDPQVPRSDTPRSHSNTRQMSLPDASDRHTHMLPADTHNSQSSDTNIYLTSRFNPAFSFSSPLSQRSTSEPKEVLDGIGDSKRHPREESFSNQALDSLDSKTAPNCYTSSWVRQTQNTPHSTDKRTSKNSSSRKRKNKGKSALNEPLKDAPIDLHIKLKKSDRKMCKSLERGSRVRTSNASSACNNSFPLRFSPSSCTPRSETPSTFYTPESSRRSSITEMTELSGATSEDVLDKINPLPVDSLPVKEPAEVSLSVSDPNMGPCDSSACLLVAQDDQEVGDSQPDNVNKEDLQGVEAPQEVVSLGTQAPQEVPAPQGTQAQQIPKGSSHKLHMPPGKCQSVPDDLAERAHSRDAPLAHPAEVKATRSKTTTFLSRLFHQGREEQPATHTPVSQASSNQSSVIGLDWLFCSDTDSVSSGK